MAGSVESEVHVFSNVNSSISYEVRRRTGQGNVKQFSTEHIASGKPRTLWAEFRVILSEHLSVGGR